MVPFNFRCAITGQDNKTKIYEVAIPLVLLPNTVRSIVVEEVVTTKGWANTQEKTIVLTRRTEGDQKYREEKWVAAENQRIAAVKYECTDKNGGFAYAVKTEYVDKKTTIRIMIFWTIGKRWPFAENSIRFLLHARVLSHMKLLLRSTRRLGMANVN